jgi:hypothetical protein
MVIKIITTLECLRLLNEDKEGYALIDTSYPKILEEYRKKKQFHTRESAAILS